MSFSKRCRRSWSIILVLALTSCLGLTSGALAATLFALTDTGELFVSTDGGETWSLRSALPVSDAAGLLAASEVGELFLASRTGMVHRSVDAGVTWNAVGAPGQVDHVAGVGEALFQGRNQRHAAGHVTAIVGR